LLGVWGGFGAAGVGGAFFKPGPRHSAKSPFLHCQTVENAFRLCYNLFAQIER